MNIPRRSLRPWIRLTAATALATIIFTTTILLVRERMRTQPLATALILYSGFGLTIVCVAIGTAPHLDGELETDEPADTAD